MQFTHKRFLNFRPSTEIFTCTIEEVSTATRSVFQNSEKPQHFPKSQWRSLLFHLSKNYSSLWIIFSRLPQSLIIDPSKIQLKTMTCKLWIRGFFFHSRNLLCVHTPSQQSWKDSNSTGRDRRWVFLCYLFHTFWRRARKICQGIVAVCI